MTTKPTIKVLASFVSFVALSGALDARVVVTIAKQNEVLNIARDLLSSPEGTSELRTDELKDPFHQVKKEAPVEEAVEKVEAVVVKERPPTDSEILGLVSKQIKPSGFIDQGGQQYLILNGKKVQDGVTFNFPHQERQYSILISEIQKKSFTLNLNSESKTISME